MAIMRSDRQQVVDSMSRVGVFLLLAFVGVCSAVDEAYCINGAVWSPRDVEVLHVLSAPSLSSRYSLKKLVRLGAVRATIERGRVMHGSLDGLRVLNVVARTEADANDMRARILRAMSKDGLRFTWYRLTNYESDLGSPLVRKESGERRAGVSNEHSVDGLYLVLKIEGQSGSGGCAGFLVHDRHLNAGMSGLLANAVYLPNAEAHTTWSKKLREVGISVEYVSGDRLVSLGLNSRVFCGYEKEPMRNRQRRRNEPGKE